MNLFALILRILLLYESCQNSVKRNCKRFFNLFEFLVLGTVVAVQQSRTKGLMKSYGCRHRFFLSTPFINCLFSFTQFANVHLWFKIKPMFCSLCLFISCLFLDPRTRLSTKKKRFSKATLLEKAFQFKYYKSYI